MSSYAYAIGDSSTVYFCFSPTNTLHLIGTFSLKDSESETTHTATLVPNIGNVKLDFEQTNFLEMLKNSTPLDVFFSQTTNHKMIDSFIKTVLTHGLFTIPCPYVDHRNIFPSMQELIDVLTHKHNAKYYAIIPLEDEQYKVFIYEKV